MGRGSVYLIIIIGVLCAGVYIFGVPFAMTNASQQCLVLDQHDQPIDGAKVYIRGNIAYTGADGYATVTGLNSQFAYKAAASAPGYICPVCTVNPVNTCYNEDGSLKKGFCNRCGNEEGSENCISVGKYGGNCEGPACIMYIGKPGSTSVQVLYLQSMGAQRPPAPTPMPPEYPAPPFGPIETPGFSALFGALGLLCIAFLCIRKRKG